MTKKDMEDAMAIYEKMNEVFFFDYCGSDWNRLAREKMTVSIINVFLKKLGRTTLGFNETVFWDWLKKDFYQVEVDGEPDGLIESGDVVTRGSLGGEGSECILQDTLSGTSFSMVTFFGLIDVYEPACVEENIPGALEQFLASGKELPKSEVNAVYAIAQSRTPKQFWSEVLPSEAAKEAETGFLSSEEGLASIDMLRDKFTASDDEYNFPNPFLVIWNKDIPLFLRFAKKARMDEFDHAMMEELDNCIKSLQDWKGVSDNLAGYFDLPYGECYFWLFSFNDEETSSYNGVTADGLGSLSPVFYLTLILMDAIMAYFNEKYHWKEEKQGTF